MKRTRNQAYSSFEDLLPESPEAVELRDNLYLARLQYGFNALGIYESIKPSDFNLRNREWELAHPLLAVARLIDERLVPHVLAFFRQINEEASDISERDEYKVLFVLNQLVAQPDWTDSGLLAMDVANRVVCQFGENASEWNSKRVRPACKLLNIKTYMSQGRAKLKVLKSQIQDLSSRYLDIDGASPNEIQPTHSTASTPTDSFWEWVEGVDSVEQIPRQIMRLGLDE
jgi:hypothetical protein